MKLSFPLKMNCLLLMAKANFSFFKFNPQLKLGAIEPASHKGFIH